MGPEQYGIGCCWNVAIECLDLSRKGIANQDTTACAQADHTCPQGSHNLDLNPTRRAARFGPQLARVLL